MKHLICILITLVVLGGCASSKQIFLETGEVGYRVKCGGKTFGSWSDCYQRAGEVCKAKGYDVVSQIYDDRFSGGLCVTFSDSLLHADEQLEITVPVDIGSDAETLQPADKLGLEAIADQAGHEIFIDGIEVVGEFAPADIPFGGTVVPADLLDDVEHGSDL